MITFCRLLSRRAPRALKSIKPKSKKDQAQNFVDLKQTQTCAGNGGDGCISFLHLWSNEMAGPDGGNGGNGGHVIFRADYAVRDLKHVASVICAPSGVNGRNKDCDGASADHLYVKVPVGTVVKSRDGVVVGDLNSEGLMFIAARGGAGGRGNHHFVTDTEQRPEISECGGEGERLRYTLEIRSMAHMGLIGLPNAGKSTLLRAISRAKPKIAPYPFTTLKPHIGMVQYDDYMQLAIADLPGLIPDSHRNRGLGVQFLKHAERCSALLYVIDASQPDPMDQLDVLQYELEAFSAELIRRPQMVIANKMDLPDAERNRKLLEANADLPVIGVSAKFGTNISYLLQRIRQLHDYPTTEEYDEEPPPA